MKNTIIISGFPGVGKTYLFENSPLSILDSDSSKFDKTMFPQNYIEHIKENIGKVDIILVSSHKDVREALVREEIEFTLVYPHESLKSEYIKKYKERGSSEKFIQLISDNWNNWIEELKNQKNCNHNVLNSGITLYMIIHVEHSA